MSRRTREEEETGDDEGGERMNESLTNEGLAWYWIVSLVLAALGAGFITHIGDPWWLMAAGLGGTGFVLALVTTVQRMRRKGREPPCQDIMGRLSAAEREIERLKEDVSKGE